MKSAASIFDILGGLTVFAFLMWTTYIAPADYALSLWRGVAAFALMFLFAGVMHMIPFIGASALPVAWEWWWHDISISEVSIFAWCVCAFSLGTKVFAIVAADKTNDETEDEKSASQGT